VTIAPGSLQFKKAFPITSPSPVYIRKQGEGHLRISKKGQIFEIFEIFDNFSTDFNSPPESTNTPAWLAPSTVLCLTVGLPPEAM
jgi:hypothetical protein